MSILGFGQSGCLVLTTFLVDDDSDSDSDPEETFYDADELAATTPRVSEFVGIYGDRRWFF